MYNDKKILKRCNFILPLHTKSLVFIALFLFLLALNINFASASDSVAPKESINASELSNEWDKVFPENPNVSHKKITFHNRFGLTLVGDLYEPKNKNSNEKFSAIAVAGPFGAVKEQVSGLYAQEMAARGFLTLAFDPAYTGESAGEPRNTTDPSVNTEDFSAAVDYLSNLENVDPERVGIIGICGWGGFGLSATAADPRIKAAVISTMYDMSRNMANGYFDNGRDPAEIKKERIEARKKISAQRTKDYKNGTYKMSGGVPEKITDEMPQFVKDYNSFYQNKRGYHPRSFGSTTGGILISSLSFMNMPILNYIDEIESPVLIIHGEKAHSRYYSEDAFKKLTGDNKELYIIPGASHVDLYYRMDVIPFDKIEKFFKDNLK